MPYAPNATASENGRRVIYANLRRWLIEAPQNIPLDILTAKRRAGGASRWFRGVSFPNPPYLRKPGQGPRWGGKPDIAYNLRTVFENGKWRNANLDGLKEIHTPDAIIRQHGASTNAIPQAPSQDEARATDGRAGRIYALDAKPSHYYPQGMAPDTAPADHAKPITPLRGQTGRARWGRYIDAYRRSNSPAPKLTPNFSEDAPMDFDEGSSVRKKILRTLRSKKVRRKSDRAIAKKAGASHSEVSALRHEIEPPIKIREVKRGKQRYTMDVSKIGSTRGHSSNKFEDAAPLVFADVPRANLPVSHSMGNGRFVTPRIRAAEMTAQLMRRYTAPRGQFSAFPRQEDKSQSSWALPAQPVGERSMWTPTPQPGAASQMELPGHANLGTAAQFGHLERILGAMRMPSAAAQPQGPSRFMRAAARMQARRRAQGNRGFFAVGQRRIQWPQHPDVTLPGAGSSDVLHNLVARHEHEQNAPIDVPVLRGRGPDRFPLFSRGKYERGLVAQHGGSDDVSTLSMLHRALNPHRVVSRGLPAGSQRPRYPMPPSMTARSVLPAPRPRAFRPQVEHPYINVEPEKFSADDRGGQRSLEFPSYTNSFPGRRYADRQAEAKVNDRSRDRQIRDMGWFMPTPEPATPAPAGRTTRNIYFPRGTPSGPVGPFRSHTERLAGIHRADTERGVGDIVRGLRQRQFQQQFPQPFESHSLPSQRMIDPALRSRRPSPSGPSFGLGDLQQRIARHDDDVAASRALGGSHEPMPLEPHEAATWITQAQRQRAQGGGFRSAIDHAMRSARDLAIRGLNEHDFQRASILENLRGVPSRNILRRRFSA